MRILVLFLAALLQGLCGWSQQLPTFEMKTDLGEIIIEVDTVNAPVTANNFLNHVKTGTYKDAVFYRVVRTNNQPGNPIPIQVIQGGLFVDERVEQYEGIPHESTKATGLKHLDGTLSMARNEPGTASTEFFICIGNQPELDFGGRRNPDGMGFAAFGRVIHGMEVVREIQKLPDEAQYLITPQKIVLSIKKE